MSFATKTKIIKFGVIAQDGTLRASSDTVIDLISAAGAATIAQFLITTAADIATADVATGVTLTTATTVAANSVVQGAVGVIGSNGNFQYYIDVQEQFIHSDSG